MTLNLYREPFEPEMLTKITNALNSTSEKIIIYLSSDGGKSSVCSAMVDLVNSNKERFEIIAYDFIGSAAFIFFIKAECEKRVLPNTIAMHHQTIVNIDLDEFKKPYYKSDEAELQRIKTELEDSKLFNERIGLTTNEHKRYNKNDELYFQNDRIIQLIENYKKVL